MSVAPRRPAAYFRISYKLSLPFNFCADCSTPLALTDFSGFLVEGTMGRSSESEPLELSSYLAAGGFFCETGRLAAASYSSESSDSV